MVFGAIGSYSMQEPGVLDRIPSHRFQCDVVRCSDVVSCSELQ